MIPYLLAVVGGYLIGDSMKSQTFGKGSQVSSNDLFDLVWSVKDSKSGVVKIPKNKFKIEEIKEEISSFNDRNLEWSADFDEDDKNWVIYGFKDFD